MHQYRKLFRWNSFGSNPDGQEPSPLGFRTEYSRNTASVMPVHNLWNVLKLLPIHLFVWGAHISVLYLRLTKITIMSSPLKNFGILLWRNKTMRVICNYLADKSAIEQKAIIFSKDLSLCNVKSFGKHVGNHFPTDRNKFL